MRRIAAAVFIAFAAVTAAQAAGAAREIKPGPNGSIYCDSVVAEQCFLLLRRTLAERSADRTVTPADQFWNGPRARPAR